jgi:hypothetical protein
LYNKRMRVRFSSFVFGVTSPPLKVVLPLLLAGVIGTVCACPAVAKPSRFGAKAVRQDNVSRAHRLIVTVQPRGLGAFEPIEKVPSLRPGDVLRVQLASANEWIEHKGLYIARTRLPTDRDSDGVMVLCAFVSPQVGTVGLTERDVPKPRRGVGNTLEWTVPGGPDAPPDTVPYLFFIPTNRNKRDAEDDWDAVVKQLRSAKSGVGALLKRMQGSGEGDATRQTTETKDLQKVGQQTQWVLKLLTEVQQDRKADEAKGVNREEMARKMAQKLGVAVPADPDAFNWTTATLQAFEAGSTLPAPERLNALQGITRLAGAALPAWYSPWIGGVQTLTALKSLVDTGKRSPDGRQFEYTVALTRPVPNESAFLLLPRENVTQNKHILLCALPRTEPVPFTVQTGVEDTVYFAPGRGGPVPWAKITGDALTPDEVARFASNLRLRPADGNSQPGLDAEGVPLGLSVGNATLTVPDNAPLPATPTTVVVWGRWGPWGEERALSRPFRVRRVDSSAKFRIDNADALTSGAKTATVILRSTSAAPLANPQSDAVWAYLNGQLGTVSPSVAERLPSGDGYKLTFDLTGKPSGPGNFRVTQAGMATPETVTEGRDALGRTVAVRVYDPLPQVRPADITLHAFDHQVTLSASSGFARYAQPVEVKVGDTVFTRNSETDLTDVLPGVLYTLRASKPAFESNAPQTATVTVKLRDGRTIATTPEGDELKARVLPRRPFATVKVTRPASVTGLFMVSEPVFDLNNAVELTLKAAPGYTFGPGAKVRALQPGADPNASDPASVLLAPSPAPPVSGADQIRVRVPREAALGGTLVLRVEDTWRPVPNAPSRPFVGDWQTVGATLIRVPVSTEVKLTYANGKYRLEGRGLDSIDRVQVAGSDPRPVVALPTDSAKPDSPRFIEWEARPGLPLSFVFREVPDRPLAYIGFIAPASPANFKAELITEEPKPAEATPAPNTQHPTPARRVRLSWEAAPGATGYRVYRAESEAGLNDANLAPLTTVNTSDVGGHVDEAAQSGKTYWYRLVAFSPIAEAPALITGSVVVP